MSHGGPLTLTQKRIMAMRTTTAEPHNTPLLPAVYDLSSSTSTDEPFGDVEMQDISAPASTASPPANYSHSRPQPSFSAAAKPFVPPRVANSTTVAMPAAISTPVKRLPPHRAMQAQTPNTTAAIPIVKPEAPASPALTEQSAIASPARRAGPHSKLGPHARKTNASTQPNTPSAGQDAEIDLQQTKTEAPPVRRETQVKAEVEAVPVVQQSATFDSALPAAQMQAPAAQQSVTSSNQMERTTRHLGRNQWLAIMDEMDDPEKGRQLILALADHLRTSVESRESTAVEPSTSTIKEVLVEFESGQRAPATVDPEMSVSEMVKECASLTNVNQSDIRVVLKIGTQSQVSEEL
ncbi:hypothetical protein KCU93_g5842, partial [Aureobasidium melanogenum]